MKKKTIILLVILMIILLVLQNVHYRTNVNRCIENGIDPYVCKTGLK